MIRRADLAAACRSDAARSGSDGERAAKALLARRINIGDRIGCWSPTTDEHRTIQVAAFRVGATIVQFAPEWDLDTAHRYLEATAPKLMFVRASHEGVQYPALLRSLSRRLVAPPEMIVHGRQPRFETLLPGGWTAFLGSGDGIDPGLLASREAAVECLLEPETIGAIVTTSGAASPLARLCRDETRAMLADLGSPAAIRGPVPDQGRPE